MENTKGYGVLSAFQSLKGVVNISDIEFSVCGVNADGEKLYTLRVNKKIVGEPMTIDEVVRQINRADELSLGERHMNTPEDRLPRHSRR